MILSSVTLRRRPEIPLLWLPACLMLLLMLPVSGCYYMQAIRGHSDLMSRRRPVEDVIADETTPAALKAKLELVRSARDFAVADLLLPDNDSYRSYADLDRQYVVWNVFAAPEFSLQPKTWCFPVAGCVAYRGYFSEDAARKFAAKLEARHYDVVVGGVPAYSTLGRFADPVLNTMLYWSDLDLVATIFHELAHQKLYVKGDSTFDESFASAVADIGVQRWLTSRGELQQFAAYNERKVLRNAMFELVAAARRRLQALYSSALDETVKRRQKQEILATLSADGQSLADTNGGSPNWLAPPLNNARLVSLTLYEGRVDAFMQMYSACKEQLDCFYARANELARQDEPARSAALDAIVD